MNKTIIVFLIGIVLLNINVAFCEDSATLVSDDSATSWIERKLSRTHVCSKCGHIDKETNSMFWLTVGFFGQLVFTSRFIIQWIKSERRKESYIPHIFWYLSIVGSILLLTYAISIEAWPIIFGQAFGIIVYSRNMTLIARKKNKEAAEQKAAKDGGE